MPEDRVKLIDINQWRALAKEGKPPENTGVVKFGVVKAEEIEGRKVPFRISRSTVDREGDIIASDGWDFANFAKNPVVLWAHNYREMPVAKSSLPEVDGDSVRAVAEFAPADVNPFAEQVLQAYNSGYLNAVSVGFIPRKWAFSEDDGRTFGIDFEEQELLEYSAVPVPAHPDALQGRSIDVPDFIKGWARKTLGLKEGDPAIKAGTLTPKNVADAVIAEMGNAGVIQLTPNIDVVTEDTGSPAESTEARRLSDVEQANRDRRIRIARLRL